MKFLQLIASLILITLLTFIGILYVHYNQIVIIPRLDTLPIPSLVKTALTNPIKKTEKIEEDASKTFESTSQDVQSHMNVLSSRSQEVGGHVQKVLGAFIEKRDASPEDEKDSVQLHQQAFEYGRYLYCTQVVKEYQSQNEVEAN